MSNVSVRWLILALIPLMLTACDRGWLAGKMSLPEDRALGRAAIGDVIAGNSQALAAKLPPQLRPELATKFPAMHKELPFNAITAIDLVDAAWLSFRPLDGEGWRDSRLTFDVASGDQHTLAEMTIRRQGKEALVTSLNLRRIDRPVTELNAFRASDISFANFLVAIIALAGLSTTIIAIRRIWSSGLFRRRWLWITGCIAGIFQISTAWGSEGFNIAPLHLTFFSAGVVRAGLAPWTITAGIPAVAIWALLRHRARSRIELEPV